MKNKIIHLSHCVYINGEIDYEWNKTVGDEYHDLPNLYAISLVTKKDRKREVLATIIVKTNMSQAEEDVVKIYSAVTGSYTKLQELPTENVTLVSTKTKFSSSVIPDEALLLSIMTDIYTQNAAGGNA
jgi:hypothetical protein